MNVFNGAPRRLDLPVAPKNAMIYSDTKELSAFSAPRSIYQRIIPHFEETRAYYTNISLISLSTLRSIFCYHLAISLLFARLEVPPERRENGLARAIFYVKTNKQGAFEIFDRDG